MTAPSPFRRLLPVLLLGSLLAAACGDRSRPGALDLRTEDGKGKASRTVTIEGESRQAVVAPLAAWSWRGRVPEGAAFHAGVQVLPERWRDIEGLTAWVVADSGGDREILDVASCRTKNPQRWLELEGDLARFAGREVRLTFRAEVAGLAPALADGPLLAWSPLRIDAAPREARDDKPSRPNVLFILVDTLRHDHLTSYGYRRDTSPNLERLLAAQGVVAEEAYSQAPWTLPSVVSFLTSRYPGEVLGSDAAAYGIPAQLPSLAEEMRKLGYATGGFIANRVLHAGNGFARGFDTFYSPPAELPEDQSPDAAALSERIAPWLRAHVRGPFFLYAHFLDPHDPYVNPDLVSGRSPYFPDYRGEISGLHMQGLHTGKIQLQDPANDLAQVNALYDNEVHYTDRFAGALLESLPPEVLRNTLVVLTSDHGEELYDHGGWKHGFTLYEDQIHVPLFLRWDGHLQAGRRLRGTVRLLDLAPTLLAAAGGTPPEGWEGIDLLPALTGRRPLPRLTAFAQHMMIGPLRAAAVRDRTKLILFNRRTPFAPADGLQEHLWSLDLQRMKRIELYDLSRDAAEKKNLMAGGPAAPAERLAGLQPALHQQLDRQIPGVRVIAQGLPAGARLEGRLEVDLRAQPGGAPPGPITWQSYFLGDDDKVEVAGREVRFTLSGEALDKGFVLQGGISGMSGVAALQVTLDGRPLAPSRLLLGRGIPYSGGAVERSALVAEGWTKATGGGLRIWIPRLRRGPIAGEGINAETERRLRALGYLQ